jgi:hypothetical protein
MPTPQNLKRNHLYREAVAGYLASHGFPEVTAITKYKPEGVRPGAHGHLAGFDKIEFITSAATTGRPTEAIFEAEAAASDQGKPFGFGILSRPSRPVEESYVILTLEALTRLLADVEVAG